MTNTSLNQFVREHQNIPVGHTLRYTMHVFGVQNV